MVSSKEVRKPIKIITRVREVRSCRRDEEAEAVVVVVPAEARAVEGNHNNTDVNDAG